MTSVALHREMGCRVGSWLKQLYPVNTAKEAARRFDVKVPTAQKWVAGRTPSVAHLSLMFKTLGPAFAAFVLQPCGDWAEVLRLEAEADALRGRVDGLNQAWDEYQRRKAGLG